MKAFIRITLIALSFSMFSNANSTISAKMMICIEIESNLLYQFVNVRKDLPVSWDEFQTISMTKSGLLQYQTFRAKTINSFALVPGAPIIQPQPGISREYSGHRLFLISRDETFTKTPVSGRYAILIKPEELDSKPVQTYSHFIHEETAQIILKQIKGFDPQRQPLAFENFDQLERNKKSQQDQLNQQVEKQLKEMGKLVPNDEPITDSKEFTRNWSYGLLLAVGISFCVFLFWRALRRPSA
jgi:hypothetical protein